MTSEDLRIRHSVRSFSNRTIEDSKINTINAVITDVNTHEAGMHFQLITDDEAPFKGFTRSYGMFKNAKNYIACVVDTSYPDCHERAGYFGMKILMRAFCLGLDTCFVSGTYSSKHVSARIRIGEKLLFLIVIGYGEDRKPSAMASLINKINHRHSGLTPMDFLDTELPWEKVCCEFPLILKGLEAVSYAPSALNKQPVGILIKPSNSPYNPVAEASGKSKKKISREHEINAKYDALINSDKQEIQENSILSEKNPDKYILQAYVPPKNPMQLIDLGIAMFSFQVAYPGYWEWGNPATFCPAK